MAEYKIRTARVADIVTLAARIWGVEVDAIMSGSRYRKYAEPRFACYLVAMEHGHSYPSIGRFICKDHSSVIHGRNRAAAMAAKCEVYAAFVDCLRELAANIGPFVTDAPVVPFVGKPVEKPVQERKPMPPPRPCKKARNRFVFDDDDKGEKFTVASENSIIRGSIRLADRIAEVRGEAFAA